MSGGGLMVCGTTSDAGKTTLTLGLCRVLARRGATVSPFKAQNMSLNSYVTASGHEIGRAQGAQALAAGVEPDVAMNPILLKPTGERTSQVVLSGRPWAHLSAAEYQAAKPGLLEVVLESLADLRRRFDLVICEGAGSPAEINLDNDIVNLEVASRAGLPAVIVGDIDRGGVWGALFGTFALLPEHRRRLVKGFVINKLRGDPALLGSGTADLERRCGVPTLGVLPWMYDVALDAEDSLSLQGPLPRPVFGTGVASPVLDVACIRLPRISNFTDLDALAIEPGVGLRLVDSVGTLGQPDLCILPGSKSTVADLAWIRTKGFDAAVAKLAVAGTTVLGICGGYQMLGRRIVDTIESGSIEPVEGLGLLDTETVFAAEKVTGQRHGRALGQSLNGYEIHHGITPSANGWISLSPGQVEGSSSHDQGVLGTNLHGLFESDSFRDAFLRQVAERREKTWASSGVCFAAAREARFDRIADVVEEHLDIASIERLIEEGVS